MGEPDVSVWEVRLGCYSLSWAAAGAAGGASSGSPWTGWKVRRGRVAAWLERPGLGPGLPGQVRPAGPRLGPRQARSWSAPHRSVTAGCQPRTVLGFLAGSEYLVLSPARPSHHFLVFLDPGVFFGSSASLVRFYFLCKLYSRLRSATSLAGPSGLAPPPASPGHTPWALPGSLPSIPTSSGLDRCQSISKEVSLASSTPGTIAPAWWFIHEHWLGKSQRWFLSSLFPGAAVTMASDFALFPLLSLLLPFRPFKSRVRTTLKTKGGKTRIINNKNPNIGNNSFKI